MAVSSCASGAWTCDGRLFRSRVVAAGNLDLRGGEPSQVLGGLKVIATQAENGLATLAFTGAIVLVLLAALFYSRRQVAAGHLQ